MVQSDITFRERLKDLDGGVFDMIVALQQLKKNIDIVAIESESFGPLVSRFKHVLRDHHAKVTAAIDKFDEGVKGVYHGPEFRKKQEFLARLQIDMKLFESIESRIEYHGTETLLTIRDYNVAKVSIEQMISRALSRLEHLKSLTGRIKEFYQAG